MSTYLYRLGRFVARFRWWVIAAWLVVALGAGTLSTALGGSLASTFEIPGTQAQTALDTLEQRFPQLSGASARVVLVAPEGSEISADEDAVVQSCENLAALDEVAMVGCPYAMPATGSTPAGTGESTQVSDDGRMVFLSVQLSVAATEIDETLVAAVESAVAPAEQAGLEAAFSGLPATDAEGVDWTELMGLVIAFIVLAVTFGSVVAAGVPLVTALIGVGVASSSILIVAAFAPVSSTAPLLATMLGLAVGIDYALLIASRHRVQLAEGMEVRESVAVATATAGTAVVFAGATVVVALLGLAVAGIPFLTVMGLGAAVAVVGAIAVALTLLPAVLAVLGRTMRPRARRRPRPVRTARWVRLSTRAPLITVLLTAGALILLAVPAAGMRLTLPDAGYDPVGTPERTAYDLLEEGFGPGFNGPLLVTADISDTMDIGGALDALEDAFTDVPDVASVSGAAPNQALDLLVLSVTPESAPSSEQTTDLVRELRSMAPAFEKEHGFTFAVTGQTALAIDISDRLGEALLPFAIVVVGLCLLLLTVMFRSIAVPISATLGYLLTVGAALGVSTAVFEWGWGAELLGVAKVGPVISFMPILVMAVLFGLAMDYHVFLVSRMREHFAETGDAHASVLGGFTASARVVTAAALIMFAVFFSFVPGGNTIIQPIALALAVGVLIDAFVVRMTFIPAVMALLGEKAWWLPRALSRVLPDADIEGEAVQRMRHLREWQAEEPARDDGVHAEGLVVAEGAAPCDLAVARGAAIIVSGPHAAALATVVSGRTAPVAGRLVVDGRPLPFDAAETRTRWAYLPARPDPIDAMTLAEHLRARLRLLGVRRRDRARALADAAAAFERLRRGAPTVPGPATPLAVLSEDDRWLLDAAAAVAAGVDGLAVDLRGRRDPAAALAAILAVAPARATVLFVADDTPVVTDRDVVRVLATPAPDLEEALS